MLKICRFRSFSSRTEDDIQVNHFAPFYIAVFHSIMSNTQPVITKDPPYLSWITGLNTFRHTVGNRSTYVSGKTSKSSTVYVKIGSKTYKSTSNSKGEYKVKIPKHKAGTKIYNYAKNSYGSSSTKSVTAIDRIAPGTPSVYAVSHTSKYIIEKHT
ncbi:peptidase domain protein [Heyndrickxia coagulans DSM 1 = ATCC 7050]|uniref:Bacterial Ig domain-containing protein n=2 Tax=Heyndrickxia TaxID=2837504 RepID=A0A8B4BXP4_HEYCO|nr:peptidase domain protein [Heyndrickxia coagulans DSM 1 = ATCC 7050]APB37722.1 hypothetical protein BIZ35_13610 [Heyndrickxia coagulans]SHF92135.1 hypothetical protein SAMN02745208_02905 [Heyndrickxia coagulans DSM 1 = ATCC 7050]